MTLSVTWLSNDVNSSVLNLSVIFATSWPFSASLLSEELSADDDAPADEKQNKYNHKQMESD